MSKYFISVYKNYLNKIESDKDLKLRYKTLKDKMALLNTSFNSYVDCIENSSWNEDGKKEIINNYIPKVRNNNNIVINGIFNNMDKVISLIKNDLYKLLLELKEKDEEYCKVQEEMKLDDLNSYELEYTKSKLSAMDKILVNLVKNIDNKIIEIKSYNDLNEAVSSSSIPFERLDLTATKEALMKLYAKARIFDKNGSTADKLKAKAEENKIKKMFEGNLNVKKDNLEHINIESEVNELDDSNCVDLSLLNENWKVVNTKLSVSEYAALAYNKGIRQNSNPEKYGDYCLAFSYVHASNMYNGNVDSGAESAYRWNHASEFTDYFNDNKQETLKVVYDQIKEGKPVVMQVNGNTQGTVRHFVTVVGVKSNVKNADRITEDDLLILDSWDGQLERMDTNSSRFMTTGKQTRKNYSGYYLRLLK